MPLQSVRQTVKKYVSFGQYSFVIGSEVRSLKIPHLSSTASSSHLGHAEYAAEVDRQLDLTYMWRNMYGTRGR